MTNYYHFSIALVFIVVSPVAFCQNPEGEPPIADAGFSRYVAHDPIFLDGTGSYDSERSDTLIYEWKQIDGPPVVILDANTATPMIGGEQVGSGRRGPIKLSGFQQTDVTQVCTFELKVTDRQGYSGTDAVEIRIVPSYGISTLNLENDSFDPNKPTYVSFFGGISCSTSDASSIRAGS